MATAAIDDMVLHLVVVRPEPSGRFVAEPLGMPELRVEADSAPNAVAQVQNAMKQWKGALFQVPVKVSGADIQGLLQWAGHAEGDPDFDAYLEEIRSYRRQVDERECSSTFSTPTT